MAVSVEDCRESRSLWLQVEILQHVQNVKRDAAHFKNTRSRNLSRPSVDIHIPTHRSHRRNLRELLEDVAVADVTGVNDVVRSPERSNRFRSKQSVGIGDDANADHEGLVCHESAVFPVPRATLAREAAPLHPSCNLMSAMEYTESSNGASVELRVHDEFAIALPETRTAGYRWSVVRKAETACQLTEDSFQPPAGVGGSGKHLWRFRAVAAGVGEIELQYGRSWQDKPEPEKTFRLKIHVRP